MLKWTDLPKIKQILTDFRFKMPHPWTTCFEDSSGGCAQSWETEELLFRPLQVVFFGNLVFPFLKTRSFSSMSWCCQVFMHNKQHCIFLFCAIISLLFSWKAMLLSSFLDRSSQRQTLQRFCTQLTWVFVLVSFVCSKSTSKTKNMKVVLLSKMRKRKEWSPRLDSEKSNVSQKTMHCELPFWLHGSILRLEFHSYLSCINGHLTQLSWEHVFKG